MEIAVQIAWDYIELTGELGAPTEASRVLLKSIETQIFNGERRRLMLSNTAINDYKKFRRQLRAV